MKISNPDLAISGERFEVVYKLSHFSEQDARKMADVIRVEQTVEYPYELIEPGILRDHIVGQIESFRPLDDSIYEVVISYAVETSGFELPQLVNVIYGNISFLPGIRVERVHLPATVTGAFKGPRFGIEGMRSLLGVPSRPLVSTALKPMGLSAAQMAEMAYQVALGGIDVIKDDHGLSDQAYCPYEERIERCVEAIARANKETGYRCLYFPTISGPMETFHQKIALAAKAGADGLMIMPGFSGLDTIRMVAEDDSIGLPIMFHPGFMGIYRHSGTIGLAPYVIHGQLSRLMGVDISIFPHFGGRFSPPQSECRDAVDGTQVDMHNIKPNLPSPGGGVKPESVEDMRSFYGTDVVFLAAGNLHRRGPDLVENSRYFRSVVEGLDS